jgi:DNA repair exonuclease SbcCD ATPase subunit
MKISIEGYQAVKKASIDVEGITMIVGSNNNGKSSICRGVISALFGGIGTDFINHDMNHVLVDIEFDPENEKEFTKIVWCKDKKSNTRYDINGQDLYKTGKKGPTDILAKHGISTLKVRKEEINLMYWEQLSEIFIVKQAPTFAFEIISSIMGDRKIYPVLKKIIGDNKVIKDTILGIEGSVAAYKQQLSNQKLVYNKYIKVHDLKPLIQETSKVRDFIEYLLNMYVNLNQVERSLSDINLRISKLKEKSNIFGDFNKLNRCFSELGCFEGLLSSLIDVNYQIDSHNKKLDRVSRCNNVLKSQMVFDIGSLNFLVNSYSEYNKMENSLSYVSKRLLDINNELKRINNEKGTIRKNIDVCPIFNEPCNKFKS